MTADTAEAAAAAAAVGEEEHRSRLKSQAEGRDWDRGGGTRIGAGE
jgi:hypothetical protein